MIPRCWAGLALMAAAVAAADVETRYRVEGLFQPDRVADLRRLARALRFEEDRVAVVVTLVDVDYGRATVAFRYDGALGPLKRRTPDQVRERLNDLLGHASRGSFKLHPPSARKPEEWRPERIAVAGHDCKGCAFAAYRAVAGIDGVERAVVSFKEGHVTAWIDPAKTNRAALVAALKKAEVEVAADDARRPPQAPESSERRNRP